MDDELKRKIAASLDQVDDGKADPRVVAALERDPAARAFVRGLRSIEGALRAWPAPARPAADWERMANAIEASLGDAPWERASRASGAVQPLAWDPLDSPPLREDDVDVVKGPEHQPMAMSHDDNQNEDDLEGLAALTRTSTSPKAMSVPPPGSLRPMPSLTDDDSHDSSGIVDIRKLADIALRQSAPPPASTLAPTSADASGRSDTALLASEPVAAKAAVPAASEGKKAAPVVAAPAVLTPVAKRSSPVVWLVPVLAAAAGVGYFALNRGEQSAPGEQRMAANEQAPTSPAQAPAPVAAPATAAAESPAPGGSGLAAAPMQATQGQAAEPPPAAVAVAEPAAAPPPPAPTAPPVVAVAEVAPAPQPARPATHAADEPRVAIADNAAGHESESRVAREATRRTPAPAADLPTPPAHVARAEAPARSSASEPASTTVAAAPRPAAPAPTAAPAAAPASAAAGTGGRARSVEELMAAAVPTRAAAGTTAPAPAAAAAELPERPAQRQVTSTLAPLSSAVRACAQGEEGMATAQIVIQSDGAVQTVHVSGPFNATVNSCIEGVVRRAHFPAFTRPSVSIVYPFSIHPPRPTEAN